MVRMKRLDRKSSKDRTSTVESSSTLPEVASTSAAAETLEVREIRGIKPSRTNFLHGYIVDKDGREYVTWLKNLQKFVQAWDTELGNNIGRTFFELDDVI